jgi:hypothetical protein
MLCVSSLAQQTFNDLGSYCTAITNVATPTLQARVQGIPRSTAEDLMEGMTDPASIRMVKEVIQFAYSRPANRSVESLKTELRTLCMAKKILVP